MSKGLPTVEEQFSAEDNDKCIIERTEKAMRQYGYRYGVDMIGLTREDIDALLAGKIIATNNGEYSQFIALIGAST